MLQSKIHQIQQSDDDIVDVVLELKAPKSNASNTPRHYIFLLDLSHSMKVIIDKKNSLSKLEKVKKFANLLVDHLNAESWLSVVSFGEEANVVLSKKKMTYENKEEAKQAIGGMKTSSKTNLSAGLLQAVQVAVDNGETQETRDAILLFTDGNANKGITEAQSLIFAYREAVKKTGKKQGIPLSAMTLGDYRPKLLHEISQQLGSDAFYWFANESLLESEMFLPVLLRESTLISDISIRITVKDDQAYIKSFSEQHLQIEETHYENELHHNQLNYFIHDMPNETSRNVSFLLQVQGNEVEGHEKTIAEVEITYMDEKMKEHTINEHIKYKPGLANNDEPSGSETSSKTHTEYYKTSFVLVQKEKSREDTIKTLALMSECSGKNTGEDVNLLYDKAKIVCDELKGVLEAMFGREDPFTNEAINDIESNRKILESSRNLVASGKKLTNKNWNILKSRETSLAKEMPAPSGTFDASLDQTQPFLPKTVEENLINIRTKVSQLGIKVLPTDQKSEQEVIKWATQNQKRQ